MFVCEAQHALSSCQLCPSPWLPFLYITQKARLQVLSLDGNQGLRLRDRDMVVLRELWLLSELSARKHERISAIGPPGYTPLNGPAVRRACVSVRHLAALAAEFATARPQPEILNL